MPCTVKSWSTWCHNDKKIMAICTSNCDYNKVMSSQNKSTNFLLKLRRNWELLASLQELWIESFRMLIICFIVSKAFSMWKLSGCPASVYFESCCENDEHKTWKLRLKVLSFSTMNYMTIKLICDNQLHVMGLHKIGLQTLVQLSLTIVQILAQAVENKRYDCLTP